MFALGLIVFGLIGYFTGVSATAPIFAAAAWSLFTGWSMSRGPGRRRYERRLHGN